MDTWAGSTTQGGADFVCAMAVVGGGHIVNPVMSTDAMAMVPKNPFVAFMNTLLGGLTDADKEPSPEDKRDNSQ